MLAKKPINFGVTVNSLHNSVGPDKESSRAAYDGSVVQEIVSRNLHKSIMTGIIISGVCLYFDFILK
jgi:hypothetical protein